MLRSSQFAAGVVAALWLTCGVLHAQTVDEIIATNLKTKGGLEKIKATNTVRMSLPGRKAIWQSPTLPA